MEDEKRTKFPEFFEPLEIGDVLIFKVGFFNDFMLTHLVSNFALP
jgi:hypothetical protein